MANQLTTPTPIRVGKAIVYIKASAVTVTNSATILSLFTAATDIQARVKNLVIIPPVGAVDKIDMIGETASALEPNLTFQNYLLEEKSWTLARVTGTMLWNVSDENQLELAMGGAGTAEPTNYRRYQYGASDSGTTRVVGSIAIHFPIGTTDLRTILLNNAYVISLGDIKATGADGHLERDFELICAPENYLDEVRD